MFTVKDNFNMSWGLLSVEPHVDDTIASQDVIDFRRYFEDKTWSEFPKHHWYNDFFNEIFPDRGCTGFLSGSPCGNLKVRESSLYKPDAKLPFVILSTRIAINAIAAVLKDKCNDTIHCEASHTKAGSNNALNGDDLVKKLRTNLTLAGLKLNEDNRAFLSERTPYQYNIYNLVLNGNSTSRTVSSSGDLPFRYDLIGSWTSPDGSLTSGVLRLSKIPSFRSETVESRCDATCGKGQERLYPSFAKQQQRPSRRCCWSCKQCDIHHYVNDTQSTCKRCDNVKTNTADQTGCIDIEQNYLRYSDPLAVLMIVVSAIGLILTIVVSAVFIKLRKTPLVMASSRELSACLLVGFFLSYVLTFAFIAKPSATSCGVRRFGLGFPLALCLGALLVKTNRISRVFNRKIGTGRPGYISPEWQLIFTALLLLVEVGGFACSSTGVSSRNRNCLHYN